MKLRTLLAAILLGGTGPLLPAAEPVLWHTRTAAGHYEVTAVVAEGFRLNTAGLILTVRDAAGKTPVRTAAPEPPAGSEFAPGRYVWCWRGEPPFTARIDFQCCRAAKGAEPALCLMPQTVTFGGETPLAEAVGKAELLPLELSRWRVVRTAGGFQNEQEFLAFLRGDDPGSGRGIWAGAGFWMAALLTLAGGFLLNLTPCVLPLIPVNLAIIGAAKGGRSGALSGLAYGGGMALAYGIAGAAAVLTGGVMGSWHGSWLFQWLVAALFLTLALGMAGIIPIDLTCFRNFDRRNVRGGRLTVVFVSGMISALLAGACVAPVVLGVLVYAGAHYQEGHGEALILPLLLGIGMALPWPLAGAGLGILPRPGRFMVWIKYGFAVVLIAFGCRYGWQGWLLLPRRSNGAAASWGRLKTAMQEARQQKRPLLVEFGASWCKNCAAMKRTTLTRSAVRQELASGWVVCDFQAEDPGEPAVAELFRRWQVKGVPAFVILDRK